ncbi:MAG: HAMP domain-containing sensor histidine kinase [Polyangiaceae bacterium]
MNERGGHERARRLRFLPLAPLAVVLLGVTAALVVAMVGLSQLERASRASANQAASLLTRALAARLSASAPEREAEVVERARARSGMEIVLSEPGARDPGAELGPDAVVAPVGTRRLSVRAGAPIEPTTRGSLLFSVAALTWILVGAAALVAYAIARDVRSDVAYVRDRITEMASEEREPAGKLIPVRNVDSIGMLTVAFNGLVERFTAAELAYRQDLAGALAYDRDRSAFLAALSHELRTPLNAILGFADVLLAEVDGPLSAEARENLEVVRSSGQHLRELIDDILELSALESGELELSCQSVDLVSLAEEVVKEARVTAQEKGLEVVLESEPTEAHGDARRIRQILANLVGNAVKFTSQGSVRVSVEPDGERWAKLSVNDTGPGIAPEDQASIFEEYRQVGDESARRAGSGLGLAITRRLVQMHDGTLDLESALGRGSTFRVWLPRRAPEASRAAETAT